MGHEAAACGGAGGGSEAGSSRASGTGNGTTGDGVSWSTQFVDLSGSGAGSGSVVGVGGNAYAAHYTMSSSADLGGGVSITFAPCVDASSWSGLTFQISGEDRIVPVVYLNNGEIWVFNGYFYPGSGGSQPTADWYSFNFSPVPLDATKISGIALYAYDASNMPIDMRVGGVSWF